MKTGDIVRFKDPTGFQLPKAEIDPRPWMLGLLVEYHTWEMIANILYEGRVVRIPARDVQLHTRGDNAKEG